MTCVTTAQLYNKVAVVTGASSGIGLEAAKDLAYRGARVIIASRNETKLKIARDEIQNVTGSSDVSYKVVNLASFESVRNLAHEIARENRLDILINNAGSITLPERLSEDGINLTMQVNFFGPFLLTYLLLPLLKASAPSRIINGSALSMYTGQIEFDRWTGVDKYSKLGTLSNSKLAMSLFTAELDRRLKGTGVTANSFDPLVVRDTDVFSTIKDDDSLTWLRNLIDVIGLDKEVVGHSISYLAAAEELKEVSGLHYKVCLNGLDHWLVGNTKLTRKLWEESKKIVKITPVEERLTENYKDSLAYNHYVLNK